MNFICKKCSKFASRPFSQSRSTFSSHDSLLLASDITPFALWDSQNSSHYESILQHLIIVQPDQRVFFLSQCQRVLVVRLSPVLMVLLLGLLGYTQRIVNKELAHTAGNQHHQYHAVSGTISVRTWHGQWIRPVYHGGFVFARWKHCCIHPFLRVWWMNSWILILVTCLSSSTVT